MKKIIKRIAPLKLAKFSALIYGLLSLLLLPTIILPAILSKSPQNSRVWPVLLLMPLLYTAMGFLMSFVIAVVYNFCAAWIGGVEVEVEDKPEV